MLNNRQLNEKKTGFTLIELLIVIGITAVLAMAALPIYGGLQVSAQLNDNSAQIAQNLRLSREQGLAGMNNAAHGIKFFPNQKQYVLYQGPSYALRDIPYDRTYTLGSVLTLSTTFISDEINFSKGLGAVSGVGTVTISHAVNGSRQVTVNKLGAVDEN